MERTAEDIMNDIEETQDIVNGYLFDMQNATTEQERINAAREHQKHQSALMNLYEELNSVGD